ncbi:Metallo-dependent hydrolase [Hygrophoropsis aurantiaca]|uniref:Metallo-dependent hydrolase n=1 Tax=Hygrophoropsis aurantiaca TaxID=72124 RepID=A0ACB8A235_9AGAM|nr:Metallo-dependent hydrolase [Hygrophoropsis aurantiaca]
MPIVAGLAAKALDSLSSEDISFLQDLPKAELHAHLNGSIPVATLLELVNAHSTHNSESDLAPDILTRIENLESGVPLADISDFFPLFGAIYALTSTPDALATATRAVLEDFLCPPPQNPNGAPQCQYLELRTTPRSTQYMSRRKYLTTVLSEIEKFSNAALIVCIDRRMSVSDVIECVDLAIELRGQGRRVVGLDLCGDPNKGDIELFKPHFSKGKAAGLGVTLHIAETNSNTVSESIALLNWRPDRLGHATFLSDDVKSQFFADIPQSEAAPATSASTDYSSSDHPLHAEFMTEYSLQLARIQRKSTVDAEGRAMLSSHLDVDKGARRAAQKALYEREKEVSRSRYKPCIEICLTSNLLCKTVSSLDTHHIRYYLKNDHPVAICTDDTLPFRTSLIAEYALLLAERPLGLGLSRAEVARLAQMAMDARFRA